LIIYLKFSKLKDLMQRADPKKYKVKGRHTTLTAQPAAPQSIVCPRDDEKNKNSRDTILAPCMDREIFG
jgi:hypothetical protein